MTSKEKSGSGCSRREFVSTAVIAPVAAFTTSSPKKAKTTGKAQPERRSESVQLTSPDAAVELRVFLEQRQLFYAATFRGNTVIDRSPLKITLDSAAITEDVQVRNLERYRVNETYRCRGVHSQAVNRCNGARISLRDAKTNTSYTLEARVFNDGLAFRHIAAGQGLRIPDEGTLFTLPEGSIVWYHGLQGHYEGVHARKEISAVPAGDWAAPPLTVKLPNDAGYASITESALVNYAGMALQAEGRRAFAIRLGHAAPPSYPFTLRYGAEEARRLASPAAISGIITSPWRVVIIAADLNRLVNSDIVANLAPPPDRKLFPGGTETAWIQPGRSVWKYLDGGANTLEEMKDFSRMASELGFEYNLIEGFWQRWSDAQLKELVDYSAEHKVRIWLWKHSKELRTPEERRRFFQHCHDFGIAGAKVDFFDHEAKEIIDLYQALLRQAAEFQIMLDFHGANKPTGESRTWPNELTREGVQGLEHRSMTSWAQHNTTLPFTRFLAGPADYTPVVFSERRKETSWAHQIASAAVFSSPLLVYGGHPRSLLQNPAAEVIKSIPSVWDETIVLPLSSIGEIAAFARRYQKQWFLAVLNGPVAKTIDVPLGFLGKGLYQALLVRDRAELAAAVDVETRSLAAPDSIHAALRAGGGFIARFSKI
ncbi:MAG TPA: glycoside hydrolase family 97 catalytic domain-containing protein [Acidobacteriota bacterium]